MSKTLNYMSEFAFHDNTLDILRRIIPMNRRDLLDAFDGCQSNKVLNVVRKALSGGYVADQAILEQALARVNMSDHFPHT